MGLLHQLKIVKLYLASTAALLGFLFSLLKEFRHLLHPFNIRSLKLVCFCLDKKQLPS
jgi:hypothetical protein